MMIDEMIAHAREKAKYQNLKYDKCQTRMLYCCEMCFHNPKCNEAAEQYEQLAEWLEELKKRRSEDYGYLADIHQSLGYRKAIDVFADKFISLFDDGEFVARLNEFPATTILELAELLKAGGENGIKNKQ